MARAKPSSKSAGQRVRALPWAAMLQAAVVIGRRSRALSAKERARLMELVRESGGRPGNLGKRERKELSRLAAKLDLKGLSRELVLISRRGRSRRKRSRCPIP